MNSPTYHVIEDLPAFITARLNEVTKRRRRSKLMIAHLAGLESERTLELFASGAAKLPLDLAISLAEALECDTRSLAIASLRQFAPAKFVDEITDESKRVAEHDQVIATVTALAVELVGLKERILTLTIKPKLQAEIIAMTETVDRLILECRELTGAGSSRK